MQTIWTALDRYANCVLRTDSSPDKFETYAGVLVDRTSTKLCVNNYELRGTVDNLKERDRV